MAPVVRRGLCEEDGAAKHRGLTLDEVSRSPALAGIERARPVPFGRDRQKFYIEALRMPIGNWKTYLWMGSIWGYREERKSF